MQTAPSKMDPEECTHQGAPSLVVSIHDVSVMTRESVESMLNDLAGEGVKVSSLLVIPDHHHRGRIDDDSGFASWLDEKVSLGHEAVLHGFHHLRPRRHGEGIAARLITRTYTAGEGEFYDLSFVESLDLLRRGREAMRRCGHEPEGFIAPAWLLGREAAKAVAAENFRYTTRIASVTDFKGQRSFSSRSMVYSVRAPWRRALSLLWNESLFRAMRNAPLLRIGLHPPDWEHGSIRRHALACIRLAVKQRNVTTYKGWLDGLRSPGLGEIIK